MSMCVCVCVIKMVLQLTCRVSVHDCLGVFVGEVESVTEEEGPYEGQFLKLVQADGRLEQLPIRLQREELIDELLGVGEEVVIVILVPVEKRRGLEVVGCGPLPRHSSTCPRIAYSPKPAFRNIFESLSYLSIFFT